MTMIVLIAILLVIALVLMAGSLHQMKLRLQKSSQDIAEFSSHMSHELKTPLAILRGESELALRLEQTPEEYRKVLEGNLQEISRMAKIIEDLLLLTRLDHQPQILKFEKFDLVDFLKEIEEAARLLAGEKKITVESDFPKETCLFLGDKAHLRRLFFDLVKNAIKFTPAYGKIRMHMRRDGGNILISVSDTGAGAEAVAGNGLSFKIAQSITKSHSGSISAENRLGKGTTFTVKLPTASCCGLKVKKT